MTYDPEHWMESTMRTLNDYAEANFNTEIYNVVMEFPGPMIDALTDPIKKTVIHFELDDLVSRPVGMGDNAFRDNYDAVAKTIQPQYATMHEMNFDVGIWASDASGGTTFRMRARQTLEFMFGMNSGGIDRLRKFSDNGDGVIEITSFSGGRFVPDTADGGFRLYRMIDGVLQVRVFSRTPLVIQEPIPTIEGHDQASGLNVLG